ncbi:hypothetical protein Tco_1058157 [Tanacetum coccineum]|uniref:Uncharacterized protein n=1 Tax=Tanacetum coccineum TaxID=301880 RepID=A0ABQ5H843_9ASTR
MNYIEKCIIARASHEQELKITLKKFSERQLQNQQCKVQEVQSSVTSSGDETSSGIVSDEEIDKQELEAHYSYHWKGFRSRALGEATSSRDSSLIALQTKQTELEKYTALNDLTSDYKILQTKLNDTLGQLKEKTKVFSDLKVKEGKDIDTMIEMEKHSAFPNPTAKTMEVLIKTLLMPLSNKTILDSHCFVHELKKEMHDDLEYVNSLKKELDELESEKADFSNIYDLLLE